jgi:Domain of unknown function (DUF5071)
VSLRIPRDKFDLDAVDAIAAAPEEAAPLIPELLGWMLDHNWPVAQALAPVIPQLGPAVGPALLDVLQGDDETGKWHVLSALLPRLTPEQFAVVEREVERIAAAPTAGERENEVDEQASYMLQIRREA